MESKEFKGPIWIQAQRVRDYFRDTIMASYTIREPGVSGAHRVFNWPLETFEELATNCILHKEYSRRQYIGIYVYKDHLSFVNHNRPLPPVTIEDLNEKTDFDDRQYLNEEIKEMFFNLDLIQSYGSGIRRAKKAMEVNGSPKLIFSPDNDTDDYTQVVVYINEEFARIQAEEEADKRGTSDEITKEITKEITNDLDEKILNLIKQNQNISVREIAGLLKMKTDSIQYRIRKLKNEGILEHKGSTKNGYWVILRTKTK